MTLLLVDGNNLLMRSVHAAHGHQVEMSSHGVDTAALHIFVQMLSRYVRQVKPTRIRVCWDAGHVMRDAAYPEYKAARRKAPEPGHEAMEDPTTPFSQAKEFLTWAGIAHQSCIGWEADDLIAVTTRISLGKIVILSGDKDLLQLVRDRAFAGDMDHWRQVTQIRPPDDTEWTGEHVFVKFGVFPAEFAQYLALVGDPGDGVPGVKGIGPKRAVALLKDNDDWQSVCTALGPERAEQARLMRSLVDLRDLDYPAPLMAACTGLRAFEPTRHGSMMWSPLEEFCRRYELNSILERLLDETLWQDPVKPTNEGVFDDVMPQETGTP